MVGRRLIVIALAVAAAPAAATAGTYSTFTLGLTGEYLGERQQLAADSAEQRTVRAAIWLAFDGYLGDPRLLSFTGLVQRSAADWENQTTADAVTIADDGSRTDQMLYSLQLRGLSALPVSFAVGALRGRDDVSGAPRGGAAAGTREEWNGDLFFQLPGFGQASAGYRETSFVADDPETLRDETRTTARVAASGGRGLVDGRLELRAEDLDLFGGLQRQELQVGYLDLGVNRVGNDRLQAVVSGNRVRTGSSTRPLGDWTDVWRSSARYTHVWPDRGWVTSRLETQQTSGAAGDFTARSGSVTVVRDLSEWVIVNGEASYLEAEDETGGTLEQPVAAVGVSWSRSGEVWTTQIYPRVSYVRSTLDGGDTSSSTGYNLFAAVQRTTPLSAFGLEVEIFENQLSIAPWGPDGTTGGAAFVAGLEKERQRLRLSAARRATSRLFLDGEAEIRRRVRLTRDEEVTETTAMARIGAAWGALSFDAGWSETEIEGGDIPATVAVGHARFTLWPWSWLAFEATGYREDRTAEGSTGLLEAVEAGVRLQYARLALFARVRDETVSGDGVTTREDRRYWIGVERTFGFALGSNGHDRRARGWGE